MRRWGFAAVVAAAVLTGSGAVAQAPDRQAVQTQPRTPLYCEDGAHAIQPFVYGDLGDLVAAYDRLEHMKGQVWTNGRFADGSDMYVLVFESKRDDGGSPGEIVGYAMVRHADGYALRSAYDAPKGLPVQRMAGTDMCAFVLAMLVKSDPARAVAFRKAWGEQHPDSTRP